jgi:hypothetical protein
MHFHLGNIAKWKRMLAISNLSREKHFPTGELLKSLLSNGFTNPTDFVTFTAFRAGWDGRIG